MAKFLLSYRVPRDYTPGRPETMAAWIAWFESLGASRIDPGHGVLESSVLGNLGADTRLGGYSLITAEALDDAVAMADGCPALGLGGGLEVGVILERNASGPATGDRSE